MALDVGTRLGAYEIAALIGAGGMGEVYRARDTMLNRDVALKVLPEFFAADPERLARLKREAQVLASLNHPNIAAIYGFTDGRALVLELVEGPTLAGRIAQGALPLDEALPIARQIAKALQNAHEHGDEVSDVLAFILTKEPEWTALPPETPAAIRRLLRRCLQKDRTRRIESAADARLEIDEALATSAEGEPKPRVSTGLPLRERIAWSLVAVAVLAAAAIAGLRYFGIAPPESAPLRFFLTPPEGWQLTETLVAGIGAPAPLAVSPDGRRVAFVLTGSGGKDELWIRPLDSLVAEPVAGTINASSPFWSPDSRSIGFFADGKLKRVELKGGPPVTICDAPNPRGGTWGSLGIIAFAPTQVSAIHRVAAVGGIPTAATTLSEEEVRHLRPSFLPDGRRFLYSVGPGQPVYVGSIDSTDRTMVLNSSDSTNVIFASGYLLYLRGSTLMAHRFDPELLVVSGDPIPVAEGMQTQANLVVGDFSASSQGVLSYQTGASNVDSRLVWVDRSGKELTTVGDPANYADFELSPEGRRLAIGVEDPDRRTRDVWIYDLGRGVRSRFTFDPMEDDWPIWSPDGGRIVFRSNRTRFAELYVKASTGAGPEELVPLAGNGHLPMSWSRDGRYVLYKHGLPIFALPMIGDPKPFQLAPNGQHARFSPDGRWVAYTSVESGQNEVYVMPFPKADAKWQVSPSGGRYPRWSGDGRELFYVATDTLMVAAIDARGDAIEIGAVRPLFKARGIGSALNYPYDVAPDGERFLVRAEVEEVSREPLTVVVNWDASLAR